jgi:hypothetical protein
MQSAPLVSGAQVIQGNFLYRYRAYMIFLVVFIILILITIYIIRSLYPIIVKGNLNILPDNQTQFKKFPPFPDLSGNFSTLPSDGYTFSADLFLPGTFEVGKIPRILLYKSDAPVHLGDNDLKGITTNPFPFLRLFPKTNIIVWADPVTNDIYVSAITQDMPDGSPTEVRSAPLQNVPIQKPFRLTVVFTKQFMEIYKNGSLEQTVPFTHSPMILSPKSYFFPQTLPLRSSVYLANLTVYYGVLTSKQIFIDAKNVASSKFFK